MAWKLIEVRNIPRTPDPAPELESDLEPVSVPVSVPASVPVSASNAAPDGDDPRRTLLSLLPELRAYARFLVRQPAEADDLVQEAVARALAALDQFQAGTSLRAWMFTILRNLFYEQSRRRRTERVALERHGRDRAAHGRTFEAAAQHGRVDLGDLSRSLFALPPLLRESLVLVGAQGMSYEEAAAICRVPVGTMKARVSRARTRLAGLMGAEVACEA